MKKLILTLFSCITYFIFTPLHSQVANGSTAIDFTITDIDGTTHNLYSYLNEGKTVYLDFFAAHCPICWNYHNQQSLKTLYNEHGPNGSTSQDIMVIAIEYDAGNGNEELEGTSGNTTGNWVSGTPYPICNPEGIERSQILNNYAVNYYPMIYGICPDKKVTLLGTQSASTLYNHVSSCSTTTSSATFSTTSSFVHAYSSDHMLYVFNTHKTETLNLTIYNVQGQEVYVSTLYNESNQVDLSFLQSGMFLYSITNETGDKITNKLFVQ